MSNKFEQLLDLLVNEEHEKANELFHELVVEKSREIYENLIAEEAEEEMDEAREEDEEEDESVEEDTTLEIGGDASDDLVSGIEDHDAMDADGEEDPFGGEDDGEDEFGGEEGGEGDLEDKVMDLEDALEELKAEFEALLAGEEHEEEKDPDIHGGALNDIEGKDDEEGEEDDEGEDEEEDEDMMPAMEGREFTREYREKVGNDWQGNAMKQQGKNLGAGTGENYPAPVEGRSPTSSGKGKPTSDARPHNIAQGDLGVGEMTGTSPNADKGSRGLVGATKGEFTKGVTKNISSSSKSGMQDGAKLEKQGSGYPNNNKTPGPVGSGTGDKAGQTSIGSNKSIVDKKQ
jgi:hypothetical protein